MEEKLKLLLTDIIKKQDQRQDTIKNLELDIERNKERQKDALSKFEKEFIQDVESGIYPNMTDAGVQKNLSEGKESINVRYQTEQKEIKNKIDELDLNEEKEKESQYNDIMSALNGYRDEIVNGQSNAENQIKNLEEQKNLELETLSKEIQVQEADLSHLLVQNRDTLDGYNENTVKIMQLSDNINELKEQAKAIDTKYNSQIADLQEQLDNFNKKLSNVNQFFGKIDLKSKSSKEIYEMVFSEEAILDMEESLEEQKAEEKETDKLGQEQIDDENPEIEELKMEHIEKTESTEQHPEIQPVAESIVQKEPEVKPVVEPIVKKESEVKPVVEPIVKKEPEVKPVIEPIVKKEPEVKPVIEPIVKKEPEVKPVIEPIVKKEPEVKPVVEPIVKKEPETQPAKKPATKPLTQTVTKPKTEVVSEPEVKENKKFSYEFSASGIKYDGKKADPVKLLKIYNKPEYQESIEKFIFDTLGNNKRVEDFIDYSDRLLYLSIILSDAKKSKSTGGITIGDTAKERIKEYYKTWDNPKSQEESNISISYDFKDLSRFSKIFKKLDSQYADEILNAKDNALKQRNRKNVTVKNAGIINTIQFKIEDFVNKAKNGIKNFFTLALEAEYDTAEYDEIEEYSENEIVEDGDSKNSTKSFRSRIKEQAGEIKSKLAYEPKYASKYEPKYTQKAKSKSKDESDKEIE